MLCSPFDECLCVIGDRSGRRIVHVLEDSVEHRPGVPGQIGHELTEFAVEVAQKQQSLLAQHREARVVNRADGIRRLKQLRHQWWKLLRERLCIRGRLQGKAEGKVVLAHRLSLALIVGSGDASSAAFRVRRRQLLRSEIEGQLVDLAREAERNLVIAVVHRRAGVHADVEGFVDGMRNGIVCGIVLRATSLPSTVSTPVPPLAGPGPS